MRGHRLAQRVADQGMFSAAQEVFEQQSICVRAVEVVRIHNGKRPPSPPSRGEDGVPGPPRLRAARRRRLDGLVRKHHLDTGADDVRHVATEQLLDFLANHEHHSAKACTRRVVHAVVEEHLAIGAYRGKLFEPAVARTEARREDDECEARCGYWAWRIRSRRNFRPRASCVSTVFSLMASRCAISA